jgi:hypothetical protein
VYFLGDLLLFRLLVKVLLFKLGAAELKLLDLCLDVTCLLLLE